MGIDLIACGWFTWILQVFLEMEDVYSALLFMVPALGQGDPYPMKIFREN
jgi:hypothetical protein